MAIYDNLLEELRTENSDLDAIEKKVTELEEQRALEEKEIEEKCGKRE